MKYKKEIMVGIISLIIVFLIMIGVSYAWLNFNLFGLKNNTIIVGGLTVVLDESLSEGINLVNTYPMNQTNGMKTPSYTFKMTNNDRDANYTLKLAKDETQTNTTPNYAIRYYLKKNNQETIKLLSETNNLILDKGMLKSHEVNTYELKLWIDYNAGNEVQNTQFNAKIKVEINQEEETDTLNIAVINNLGNTGTVYTASTGVKYIRGESNVVNNYLWYSGMMWRIFAVNPDGSVKAITDDNVSAFSFNTSNNAYEGSHMQKWLNIYFWERLNTSKTSVLKQNNEFCNDAIASGQENISARETCTKKILNQKVGLLSLDEYNIVRNGSNSNYLNNGNYYWTSSPDGGNASNEWFVSSDGHVGNLGVNFMPGVRPVTVFASALVIFKGNGTQLTPYKLTTDTALGVAGTKLNLRHSGEFINYDNKLWRIMEVAGGMTKVVYDGSPVLGGTAAFGTDNLDWNTMKTRLDGIGISTTKIALNQTWQRCYYREGDVMETSLGSGSPVTSTIGLVRVGEMWSSQNNNKTNNYSKYGVQYYWTMTPYNGNASWEWSVGLDGRVGNYGVTNAWGVRAVFFFKEDTTISGGNGTPDSPYNLQ